MSVYGPFCFISFAHVELNAGLQYVHLKLQVLSNAISSVLRFQSVFDSDLCASSNASFENIFDLYTLSLILSLPTSSIFQQYSHPAGLSPHCICLRCSFFSTVLCMALGFVLISSRSILCGK